MTESDILYIAVELLADMGQVLNREYTLAIGEPHES